MPQLLAQPMSHIPERTERIQNANPPANHHREISSQKCSASNIHAGMLHSRFSRRFISRHSRKLPLRFVLLTPRGLRT